jgi:hypothetical protein
MVTPLDGVPKFSYRRERQITPEETNAEAQVREDAEISDEMVEELFDQVQSLLDKTDMLDAEVKRTANPFIPVHEDALEVQLALRTLYPEARDDVITFEQFILSLQYLERQAQLDPVKINELMTGNQVVDGRILNRETTMAATHATPEEILVMGGQFLLLAVCNRMLQTFQAPNTQLSVAGKQPAGAELGPTILQFLVGLAAIMLQTLTNEKEVTQVLNESFGDAMTAMRTTPEAVITEAKNRAPDELMMRYGQSRSEEHQAAIRQYSTDYVIKSTEPGYEPWIAAGEIRDVKNDLQASASEITNYGRTVGEIATAPYTMSAEIYKLMLCRNMNSNSRLDKLAAVLSSKYSADLVCCFVRFAGAIPVDTLKQMRLMLHLAANGMSIDLSEAFNAATDRLNAHLERQLLEPIMHTVDNFFRSASERLTNLLDPSQHSDPEAFKSLLICTPIDEAFTYILSALQRLRGYLTSQIRRYWTRLELKSMHSSVKIEVLADSKRAKIILRLMDSVIEALDRGNLCAREDERTPSPEDAREYVDRLVQGLPAAVQVPTDGADPYKTFSSVEMQEFKSAEGISVLRPIDKDSEHGLRDCARVNVTDRTTAAFRERGASQE